MVIKGGIICNKGDHLIKQATFSTFIFPVANIMTTMNPHSFMIEVFPLLVMQEIPECDIRWMMQGLNFQATQSESCEPLELRGLSQRALNL